MNARPTMKMAIIMTTAMMRPPRQLKITSIGMGNDLSRSSRLHCFATSQSSITIKIRSQTSRSAESHFQSRTIIRTQQVATILAIAATGSFCTNYGVATPRLQRAITRLGWKLYSRSWSRIDCAFRKGTRQQPPTTQMAIGQSLITKS